MKYKISLLLIVGVLVFSALDALAFEYKNNDLHYTINFPAEWIEIPHDVLEDMKRGLAKQTKLQVPNYIAGFQKSSKDYFTYPYCLIQNLPVDTATISQLKNALSDTNWDETKASLESTDFIRNTSIGKPITDTERKMILMTVEAEYPGIGIVKGLMASVPGKDGMANVMFYDLSSQFDKSLPMFESVLDSFRFDSGYEYSWIEKKARFWGPVISRGFGKALVGGIVAAIAAFFISMFRSKKKNV